MHSLARSTETLFFSKRFSTSSLSDIVELPPCPGELHDGQSLQDKHRNDAISSSNMPRAISQSLFLLLVLANDIVDLVDSLISIGFEIRRDLRRSNNLIGIVFLLG